MSTSDLQLFYEKEQQKLEILKERLDDALSQKQTAESLFKEIKVKISNLETSIEKLEIDKYELMSKHNFKMDLFSNVFFGISGLLIIFLAFGGLVGIPMFIWNVLKMQIFNSYEGTLTFIGSLISYYVGLRFLCVEIIPKIGGYLLHKMKNYLNNKIMNSTKYKELDFLYEVSLELYERESLDYKSYKEEKDKTNKSYSAIKEEYDTKKGIVEYLDRQINPVETTIHKSKEHNPKI